MISISELAEIFEVSVRTIRYYDSFGLIKEAGRKGGKRYYKKQETLDKMKKIIFLKSLNYELNDIKQILEKKLCIQPLAINIRLHLIRIEINNLENEAVNLEEELFQWGWKEITITNESIIENLRKTSDSLGDSLKHILKKKELTSNDSKIFVDIFKKFYEERGIAMLDEHLKLIAFSKNHLADDDVRRVLRKYFE